MSETKTKNQNDIQFHRWNRDRVVQTKCIYIIVPDSFVTVQDSEPLKVDGNRERLEKRHGRYFPRKEKRMDMKNTHTHARSCDLDGSFLYEYTRTDTSSPSGYSFLLLLLPSFLSLPIFLHVYFPSFWGLLFHFQWGPGIPKAQEEGKKKKKNSPG